MRNPKLSHKSRLAPLAGGTFIVTRPVGMGASMIKRLQLFGGKAIHIPGLSIRPVANAEEAKIKLRASGEFDGIIFVSPNAVRHTFSLVPELSFSPQTRVAAIGMVTANALVRRGVNRVIVSSERQDSEGLLALHELDSLHNQQWALIGAPGGREVLAQTLRERGAKVQSILVYERLAPRLGHHHVRLLMTAVPPLFVFCSSAESLMNLSQCLPSTAWSKLLNAQIIVSSSRLADIARQHGFEQITQACSATMTDLITAAQKMKTEA